MERRVGSTVGAPIMVDGEGWGHVSVEMPRGVPLPDRIEDRLGEFTELVATAISSSATRRQLARLADEQAALRRVASLVAHGAPPDQVFDAVAEELGRLLDAGSSGLVRFEDEHTATVVAGWGRLGEEVPTGSRLPIGGVNVITEIARTGRPARLDDVSRVAAATSGPRRGGCRPPARSAARSGWRAGCGARWSRRPSGTRRCRPTPGPASSSSPSSSRP